MKTVKSPRSPRLARGLLSRFLGSGEHWGLIGDLDEIYAERAREKGRASARAWYWGQIAKFAPAYLWNSLLWSKDMFKNHMLIAWRNIKKSKAYSALNILGLAAGMAVFILIMLFVRTELSYDRYHANAKNIYRVVQQQPGNDYEGSDRFAVTPAPLAKAMEADFPEVRAAARVDFMTNVLLDVGDKTFLQDKVFWADPQTFEIFSFPLVRGDQATALRDPSSTLVSERTARRLFGRDDPVGRTIRFRVQDRPFDFKVTGVFRDIPANSHFDMDVVAPFTTLASVTTDNDFSEWDSSSYFTYALLRDGADPKSVEGKFPAFLDKYRRDDVGAHHGRKTRLILQPLAGIHLSPRINFDLARSGDPRFVFLLASIAVLVLIIACVNDMNLATARSLKRAKEVGLRKVVGAAKGQLVRQFLGDSILMTFLALILAVGAVLLVLPAFRSFVERDIAFDPLRDPALTPALLLLALVVGVAAGGYPAFFVSAFRPAATLKGTGASRAKGKGLRNGLIVFQFAASIALIICTIGVRSQLRYIRGKDMGFDREQIVVLRPRGAVRKDVQSFRTELRKNPAVLGVSASACLPNSIDSNTNANWPGRPDGVRIPIYWMSADYDYLSLFGLKLAEGRGFSREFPSDAKGAYLINESAQKVLGWKDPVGRAFGGKEQVGTIVGVLKDFHQHSLHLPIMPLYISLGPDYARYLSIKIRGGNIPETLDFIKRTWRRLEPDYPFEYRFFDDIFNETYRAEQRMGTMFSLFAGLAVLIACLGLVGLASFTAERKTKEIGIRKVLGASSSGVIVLLSREFMKWVVVANLIAWPVGYFVLRSWLRNFAYRTSLTVPMFLGAALAAFAIAAAVISLQTYRAATANPADSIRYE
jgi:putative ABC transport system permease protein